MYSTISGVFTDHSFKALKLLTAVEAAECTLTSPDRLIELAKLGLAPCIWLEETKLYFYKRDIVEWVKTNLFCIQEGKTLGETIEVVHEVEKPRPPSIPLTIHKLSGRLCTYRENHYPPCVYFLTRAGDVVYVGQTTNLRARMKAHRREKDFENVFYLPAPECELDEIEGSLIRTLKPELNRCDGPTVKDPGGKVRDLFETGPRS